MSELKMIDLVSFYFSSHFHFHFHLFSYFGLRVRVSMISHITIIQYILHMLTLWTTYGLQGRLYQTTSLIYIRQISCTWNSIKFSYVNPVQGLSFDLTLSFELQYANFDKDPSSCECWLSSKIQRTSGGIKSRRGKTNCIQYNKMNLQQNMIYKRRRRIQIIQRKQQQNSREG